jgi:hypothetical protein
MRVMPIGVESCCAARTPRFYLDSLAPYPKAPPKLWALLSDGSHRSYFIWWEILLMALHFASAGVELSYLTPCGDSRIHRRFIVGCFYDNG